MASDGPVRPKDVFISYSHEDEDLRAELETHLKALQREGLIETWHDRKIAAGDEWRGQIAENLEKADVILLLVSASFIASDYRWEVFGRALERHAKDEAVVVPVIIRPCAWRETRLAGLQPLPRDGTPVTMWPSQDQGWLDVVEGLVRVLRGNESPTNPSTSDAGVKAEAPGQVEVKAKERSISVGRDASGRFGTGEVVVLGDFNVYPPSVASVPPTTSSTKPRPKPTDETPSNLKALYRRRKELILADDDTKAIEVEILNVKRLLRQGPQLHPGEYLADGRYELVKVVGQGGFATVWKAWDEEKERTVAAKVLHGHFSEDRSRRERFFRGARKMAELTHPHIVRVLDPELDDEGFHFFVMEYLDGGNFEKAVLDGRLTEADRIRTLLEVGDALAYAHTQGIVHRDVKPSNVLLAADGTAKLTDFDLVRADDTTGMTRTQAMMGTLLFAAPETLETAAKAGPPADVYSLGATAVFALMGSRLPAWFYRAPERAVGELNCSKRLMEVLRKAIAFEADKRFTSLDKLCHAINEATSRWPKPPPMPSVKLESPKLKPTLEEFLHWIDTPSDGRVKLWQEIPAGEALIGSSDSEGYDHERPRHRVKVIRPFVIAAVPVPNLLYAAFQSGHTFEDKMTLYPAVNIDWKDAMAFCCWLGETFTWARGARLPTEEEWEYACRAGTDTCYWSGDSESDLARFGWYAGNSGDRLHRSGEKKPNLWGLYDMHGNVWEWTLTGHDLGAFKTAYQGRQENIIEINPMANLPTVSRDVGRVIRGGSFRYPADWTRSAIRDWKLPGLRFQDLGFRVLLPAAELVKQGSR